MRSKGGLGEVFSFVFVVPSTPKKTISSVFLRCPSLIGSTNALSETQRLLLLHPNTKVASAADCPLQRTGGTRVSLICLVQLASYLCASAAGTTTQLFGRKALLASGHGTLCTGFTGWASLKVGFLMTLQQPQTTWRTLFEHAPGNPNKITYVAVARIFKPPGKQVCLPAGPLALSCHCAGVLAPPSFRTLCAEGDSP